MDTKNSAVMSAAMESVNSGGSIRIGKLVGFAKDGGPLVDTPGLPEGPIEAGFLDNTVSADDVLAGARVLLLFDPNVDWKPVILGKIGSRLAPPKTALPVGIEADGRVLSLTAHHEIVLKCGKSSITLRKDGKLVIEGDQVVTRAARTNKIRGATVLIN